MANTAKGSDKAAGGRTFLRIGSKRRRTRTATLVIDVDVLSISRDDLTQEVRQRSLHADGKAAE